MSHPVVFLCTGNAARSVMGGAALAAHLPDWHVTTAGTLVVEGQPMSWRTKAALDSVGLSAPSHRSRQATEVELRHAALVIALAPEHVQWVRRTHKGCTTWAAGINSASEGRASMDIDRLRLQRGCPRTKTQIGNKREEDQHGQLF